MSDSQTPRHINGKVKKTTTKVFEPKPSGRKLQCPLYQRTSSVLQEPAPNYLSLQPSRITPKSFNHYSPVPPKASSPPPRSTVCVLGRKTRPAHEPCTPQLKTQTRLSAQATNAPPKAFHIPHNKPLSSARSHRSPPPGGSVEETAGGRATHAKACMLRDMYIGSLIDAPRSMVEWGDFLRGKCLLCFEKSFLLYEGVCGFGGGSA